MDKDEKVNVMKKTYKKPDLYYENFALVEAISSCDLKSNFNQLDLCLAYESPVRPGMFIFSSQEQGCDILVQADGSECYGNPTPGYSIWSS